jgi:hypothetical protein
MKTRSASPRPKHRNQENRFTAGQMFLFQQGVEERGPRTPLHSEGYVLDFTSLLF